MDNLMRIAEEALAHYPVACESIVFIARSANTVYRVEDTAGNRYCLRLHLSISESLENDRNTPDAIRSEMVWLEALGREADLTAPVPVRNGRGSFVTVARNVSCTLLTWVEGEQREGVATALEAEAVGEMIGKMHRQSRNGRSRTDSYVPRSTIPASRRRSRGWTSLPGRIGSPRKRRRFFGAGIKAVGMMNALERTPGHWGLIHGDLNPGNIVFYGAEARPIDFGACGFGHYLYDLGWALCHISPSLRAHVLQAYSRHRKLPEHHVELLEGFFIASQLDTMSFWLGLPDWTEWLPDHIRRLAGREASAYLKGDPFLFSATPNRE